MEATIQPSGLKGIIEAPASKSSMQRACAAALFTEGETIILNPGRSNDDKAALAIIQNLGAVIKEDVEDRLVISGDIFPYLSQHDEVIDCGESGLSIRMFTPIIALCDKRVTVTGSGSLLNRPMHFFDEILPKLGVQIKSNDGKAPFIIQGPLKPADIEIDGSLSSQYLTGLLFAYAGADRKRAVTIKVNDLKSKPYVDLTLDVMRHFGLQLPDNRDYKEFYFPASQPPQATSRELSYTVEGDWSGGAFLLVAGAIAGPILVSGLDVKSSQADTAIVDALMAANAGIAFEAKGIRVVPTEMNAFDFDATDCPDLFPPLVALAAYCKGKTRIKGVSRLTHKESNRALTLQDEFDKMGITIDLEGDYMIVHGGGIVKGADVQSHHDHRIAMACAVAGLKADSEMVIEDAQAVNKSYPDFFDDLQKMGASVALNNKLRFHE